MGRIHPKRSIGMGMAEVGTRRNKMQAAAVAGFEGRLPVPQVSVFRSGPQGSANPPSGRVPTPASRATRRAVPDRSRPGRHPRTNGPKAPSRFRYSHPRDFLTTGNCSSGVPDLWTAVSITALGLSSGFYHGIVFKKKPANTHFSDALITVRSASRPSKR